MADGSVLNEFLVVILLEVVGTILFLRNQTRIKRASLKINLIPFQISIFTLP